MPGTVVPTMATVQRAGPPKRDGSQLHQFATKGQVMKKVTALAIALLCGGRLLAAGHDNDSVVSWRNIAGVITAHESGKTPDGHDD